MPRVTKIRGESKQAVLVTGAGVQTGRPRWARSLDRPSTGPNPGLAIGCNDRSIMPAKTRGGGGKGEIYQGLKKTMFSNQRMLFPMCLDTSLNQYYKTRDTSKQLHFPQGSKRKTQNCVQVIEDVKRFPWPISV